MADAIHMLTTTDNPFNPFTDYDDWLAFDEDHGYYTNALLARVAVTSDQLSDSAENFARERAIDEIISEDPTGMYTRATKDRIINDLVS